MAGLVAAALQLPDQGLIRGSAARLGRRLGAALVGFRAPLTLIAALFQRVRGLKQARLKALLPPLDFSRAQTAAAQRVLQLARLFGQLSQFARGASGIARPLRQLLKRLPDLLLRVRKAVSFPLALTLTFTLT